MKKGFKGLGHTSKLKNDKEAILSLCLWRKPSRTKVQLEVRQALSYYVRIVNKSSLCDILKFEFHWRTTFLTPVVYFTEEVNQSLAKLPLNFSGGLAKLQLVPVVK